MMADKTAVSRRARVGGALVDPSTDRGLRPGEGAAGDEEVSFRRSRSSWHTRATSGSGRVILLEQREDLARCVGRFPRRSGRTRSVAQDRGDHVDRARALERRSPSHLVKNDAEREDVRSRIDLAAARLFRRHVGDVRRPGLARQVRAALGRVLVRREWSPRPRAWPARVQHLDAALARDHHVRASGPGARCSLVRGRKGVGSGTAISKKAGAGDRPARGGCESFALHEPIARNRLRRPPRPRKW